MKEYNLNKMSLSEVADSMMMDRDLTLDIAENMIIHGGSFVKALGECFIAADPVNTKKLAEAFIEYVLDYGSYPLWQKEENV